MRIGAIEIGAGSVRFVALDIAADNSFDIIASEGCSIDLQIAAHDMDAVNLAVRSAVLYGRHCAHLCCEQIVTFITAPGRRSDQVRDCFKKNIPSLIVLPANEEALFALFGSTLRLRRNLSSENSFCVLDVGRGSIELARGKRDSNFVKLLEWRSWLAGTHVARDILANTHDDVTQASGQLRTLIHSQKFTVKSDERVIALGNCVTNLARIINFPQMRTPDMGKVHGLELTIQNIADLLELRQLNPQKFTAFVEGHGTFADPSTTLAGLLALQLICEMTSIKRFTVSTYGVRFGLAVRCAQKLHSGATRLRG